MREIDNTENIIDSRDVIARIKELRDELGDDELDRDEREELANELASFENLAEQAEASPDWNYGETLIRDSYFEDYARELAEDCGMLANAQDWPLRCIDWEQATDELKQDYLCVDFDGVDYWIRA